MDPVSPSPRLISIKLTPVGRVQHVALEGPATERAPRPGEQVVVQTEAGPAVGMVVPTIPQIAERRRAGSEPMGRVVRLATRDDITTRLEATAP